MEKNRRKGVRGENILKLLPPTNGRIIVLDTETTGVQSDDKIIEVGAVEIVNMRLTGRQFRMYVDTPKPITASAKSILESPNDVLCKFFSEYWVFEKFMEFLGSAYVVGHNISFDNRMIARSLLDIKKKHPESALPESLDAKKVFCTMKIFRQIFPGERYNLDSCCQFLNISINEREKHGALLDSRLTAKLLLEFYNLALESESALRAPPVITDSELDLIAQALDNLHFEEVQQPISSSDNGQLKIKEDEKLMIKQNIKKDDEISIIQEDIKSTIKENELFLKKDKKLSIIQEDIKSAIEKTETTTTKEDEKSTIKGDNQFTHIDNEQSSTKDDQEFDKIPNKSIIPKEEHKIAKKQCEEETKDLQTMENSTKPNEEPQHLKDSKKETKRKEWKSESTTTGGDELNEELKLAISRLYKQIGSLTF